MHLRERLNIADLHALFLKGRRRADRDLLELAETIGQAAGLPLDLDGLPRHW